VNDPENGQASILYRPIISLSLTSHALNRISSTHIATNISLTDCCVRWDLFLRTVTTNTTYAQNVKYLKLSEAPAEDRYIPRPIQLEFAADEVCELFGALSGLEVLFSYHGKLLYPGSIVYRLTSKQLSMWETLNVVRFDHINAWDEERLVEFNLIRGEEEHTDGRGRLTGGELLTGKLQSVGVCNFFKIPKVDMVKVSTRDFDDVQEDTEDGDWMDVDEASDGWSERDYEEDSEWDSDDSSDYEDDWDAEYGFDVPDAGPLKYVPTPPSETADHTLGAVGS
jgi:hypothetical protein